MNLATPAPKVEKAEASPAPRESAVYIERAKSVEPAIASPALPVDAAKPYDDPREHAPLSVLNATTQSLWQAQQSLGVEALRAHARNRNGKLDFESYAAVIQGPPFKNMAKRCLPCIFDERDFVAYGEVKYFVAAWEQVCFVYAEETSRKPYFAIDLSRYFAVQEDPNHPDRESYTISPEPDTNRPRPTMITILLKSKKDRSQAYQFSFETANDKTLAKRFLDVVQQAKEVVEGCVVEGEEEPKKNSKS
ncbi:hypothetical protein ACA910_001714 [Epithemia clementina (nom. ined.)]